MGARGAFATTVAGVKAVVEGCYRPSHREMDGGSCLSEEHDEATLLDKWLSEYDV